MAADQHKPDRRKSGPSGAVAQPPIAALLFDPHSRPALADIVALAQAEYGFAVTHQDEAAGLAELLRDGLTFDCHGLAPGQALRMGTPLQCLTLPAGFSAADHALVTLVPGTSVAGAQQSLPVVRILAGLVIALGALPGLRAVAWLPARLAMPPAWFAEAVAAWLHGGPFPALALTALDRTHAGFASRGLAYFTGQEFVWTGHGGTLCEADARGAVRLTDWLVAHGRIDTPCDVELTGFGTVRVAPDGADCLRVARV